MLLTHKNFVQITPFYTAIPFEFATGSYIYIAFFLMKEEYVLIIIHYYGEFSDYYEYECVTKNASMKVKGKVRRFRSLLGKKIGIHGYRQWLPSTQHILSHRTSLEFSDKAPKP